MTLRQRRYSRPGRMWRGGHSGKNRRTIFILSMTRTISGSAAVTSAAARMVRLPDPTLRVGGPASFVALDEDPREALPQGRVPNILATVRHGQVVYGDLP